MRRTRILLAMLLIMTIAGISQPVRSAVAAPTPTGGVVAYPLVDLDGDSNFTATPTPTQGLSMTVGGKPVNIQDNRESSQTRFAISGPQRVVITVAGGVSQADIRPAAFKLAPDIAGDTISFMLDRPRYFAVDINGVTDRLLVFADPIETGQPRLGDPGVVDVTSFAGAKNDGTPSTAALQAALNTMSARYDAGDRGSDSAPPVLYFPDGVYTTSLLKIPSNIQIYLDSAAVILADPDITKYPKIAPDYADQTNVSAMLLIRGVHNVKIFGHGMINGGGYRMYQSYQQKLRLEILYSSQGARNLTFSDIMLTNSLFYQSHFQGSDQVHLTNVKFNNPEGGPVNNDDGFKVNSSTNVSFHGGWISARDDAMTFAACCGATEAIKSTANVQVSNIVLDGSGTASADIRFAFTDYGHSVSGVSVSNIYDIGRHRGEALLVTPSGSDYTYRVDWGGIRIRNWDIEESEPLVDFDLSDNDVPVTISDFSIADIRMPATQDNFIKGGPNRTFDHVHLSNIMLNGAAANWGTLQLATNQYADDVTIDGVTQDAYQAGLDLARTADVTTTSMASGQSAVAATDGNDATFFTSTNRPAFPQYLTFTWPTPQSVSSLTYRCDDCQGQGLTSWDVQTRTADSAGWATVATTGDLNWSSDDTAQEKTVSFPAVYGVTELRIKINSANLTGGHYRVNEIEIHAPADLAVTATSTTSSIRDGDGPGAANDGDLSTDFASAFEPTFPQYLDFSWTAPQRVNAVTYTCGNCQRQGLTDWDIQTSADGSTGWATVAVGKDSWADSGVGQQEKRVTFPTVYGVRAVRLKINSANTDGGRYLINEVVINGPTDPALTATATTTSIRDGDSPTTANDGDVYTFFKSAMHPTFPQYLTLTWTSPQQASALAYVCDYCQGQGLTNWDIQVSTDGVSNWTTVASSGDVSWAHYDGTREEKVTSFPTQQNIKGIRMKINNAKLDFGQYQIDEVQLTP